jgi:signal peptidase II
MRLMFIVGLLVFIADQISKYVVIHMMGISPSNKMDLLPPILNLRYGENRWTLIVVALIICLAVGIWVLRNAQPRIVQISAGCLIGGALGNVFDRVYYGYVLDFLNTSCCGLNNPTVYNVGDIFIFAGALGLVFFAKESGSDKKGA